MVETNDENSHAYGCPVCHEKSGPGKRRNLYCKDCVERMLPEGESANFLVTCNSCRYVATSSSPYRDCPECDGILSS